jgi:hypothetical protein
LELNTDFHINLNNVLCVPTVSRKFISVSYLDDSMYECKFRNNQFVLNYCSNKNVGLRVKRGKLYMRSLNDHIFHMSDVSNDEHKWKGTSTSSKLLHRNLGHILREGWKDILKMRMDPRVVALDLLVAAHFPRGVGLLSRPRRQDLHRRWRQGALGLVGQVSISRKV